MLQGWGKGVQRGGSSYLEGRQGRCLHQLIGVGIREGRCIPQRSKVVPVRVGKGCGSQQQLDGVIDHCHYTRLNQLARRGMRATVGDKGGATRGAGLRVFGGGGGEGGRGEGCLVPG